VDGLVTALLGGLLVAEWPSDSLWAVGTLFGISLFVTAVGCWAAPTRQRPSCVFSPGHSVARNSPSC